MWTYSRRTATLGCCQPPCCRRPSRPRGWPRSNEQAGRQPALATHPAASGHPASQPDSHPPSLPASHPPSQLWPVGPHLVKIPHNALHVQLPRLLVHVRLRQPQRAGGVRPAAARRALERAAQHCGGGGRARGGVVHAERQAARVGQCSGRPAGGNMLANATPHGDSEPQTRGIYRTQRAHADAAGAPKTAEFRGEARQRTRAQRAGRRAAQPQGAGVAQPGLVVRRRLGQVVAVRVHVGAAGGAGEDDPLLVLLLLVLLPAHVAHAVAVRAARRGRARARGQAEKAANVLQGTWCARHRAQQFWDRVGLPAARKGFREPCVVGSCTAAVRSRPSRELEAAAMGFAARTPCGVTAIAKPGQGMHAALARRLCTHPLAAAGTGCTPSGSRCMRDSQASRSRCSSLL